MSKRQKVFLDVVHGYIRVPDVFCEKFIDTENFQRLRRIEQISSRSLFPCARHDRFVHSLGVYYIGEKIISTIESDSSWQLVNKDEYEKFKQSFLIACLLHDVGHSPFSHTLEEKFGEIDFLFDKYKEKIGESDSELDNVKISTTDVKQHEILSSLLCATAYKDAIHYCGADCALVGRMIMGLKYDAPEKSFQNCLIMLLHGDVIDADKLDYLCRDSWASGYISNSVDVERIVNAIVIYKKDNQFFVAFKNSALYEIQSLVDKKNFQTNWVFKHHQVVYEQYIFRKCVEELLDKLDVKKSPQKLFNYESFLQYVKVNDNVSVYMLSDDDVISLMKTYKVKHFKEWFSRNYEFIPVFKTYSELLGILGEEDGDKLLNNGEIYNVIEERLKNEGFGEPILIEKTPKISNIGKSKLFIYYSEDKIVDYTMLGVAVATNDCYNGKTFKYIFIPKECERGKEKAINVIRNVIRSV